MAGKFGWLMYKSKSKLVNLFSWGFFIKRIVYSSILAPNLSTRIFFILGSLVSARYIDKGAFDLLLFTVLESFVIIYFSNAEV